MRLFAGIPLAAAVIDELSAISIRLRSNDDGLRWSAPESWHITLQFWVIPARNNTIARSRDLASCARLQFLFDWRN